MGELQNIFDLTPYGRDLAIYAASVYGGRYFMDAISSFYINSWQVEFYRCGFSFTNIVTIQITVNHLRSVLKWTTVFTNAAAYLCYCGNVEPLNIHVFFVADSLKLFQIFLSSNSGH